MPTRWNTKMEEQLIEAVTTYGYDWQHIQQRYFPEVKIEAIQNKWFIVKRRQNLNSLGVREEQRQSLLRQGNHQLSHLHIGSLTPDQIIDRILKIL